MDPQQDIQTQLSRAAEQLQPVFRDIAANIIQANEQMALAFKPVLDNIRQFVTTFYEAVRQDYESAGMPYGESDEGMMRWFQERMEIVRLEREAESIRERHQMLADNWTTITLPPTSRWGRPRKE